MTSYRQKFYALVCVMREMISLDKYEYKIRLDEINKLIDCENYTEAASMADTIDWRRVKSISTLLKIAALYRVNRRNDDARAVMAIAYERYPTNRSVLYSLCEIAIETDDVVAAIEYYKQFVKIAPRDNGVYILRYRILEAQEASLEERIELLEELKKRYYQEEWGYELAYLYHRVGLVSKCIEECNQMVIWFSDGPYVKKALELKMLHTTLTPEQQKIYDDEIIKSEGQLRKNHVKEEAYTEENYSDSNHYDENGNYIDPQNYNNESYYNEEGAYAAEDYNNADYYDENGNYIGPQNYSNEGYYSEEGAYAEEDYNNADYYDENGNYIGPQNYSNEGYYSEEGAYAAEDYNNADYYDENGNYIGPQNYSNEGYYGEEGAYAEEDYNNADYYDENGNYIGPQDYSSQGYYADKYAQTDYDAVQYKEQDVTVSSDMSQYNTINLQKVVAESMKEIFPDENNFVKEREEFIKEEQRYSEDLQGIRNDADNDEPEETKQIKSSVKVTDMVAGVVQTNPEPNSGAIKAVFLPGDDARVIKEESDIEKLRDTTEISVNEEQMLMEEREENVYHEPVYDKADLKDEFLEEFSDEFTNGDMANEEDAPEINEAGVEGEPEGYEAETYEEGLSEEYTEGEPEEYEAQEYEEGFNEEYAQAESYAYGAQEYSGDIENALSEWERIKQENARRHEEELRKRVLSQTGQILADFDTSIQQSEILGGLEIDDDIENIDLESEEEQDYTEYVSDDTFLQAEETVDMPVEEIANAEENNVYEFEKAVHEDADEPVSDIELAVRAEMGGDTVDIPSAQIEDVISENDEVEELSEIQEFDGEYANSEEYSGEYQDDYYSEDGYAEQYDDITASDIDENANEGMLNTKEIVMNTEDISNLQEKIIATTKKESKGAKREEVRPFTEKEHSLFDNFAVTKRIKKQTVFAIDNMTLASYIGNVVITGEPGMDTIQMAKNLIRAYQELDANFSGKVAKTTGKKLNNREIRETLERLNNGALIIEKANGIKEEKLYELAVTLNQENLGIIIIIEDTKKEITKLFQKQAMISDYFNLRIDLVEMDTNSLVEYAKNYAFSKEYSIDELGILALYSRIANMQSGNHVVTKMEVKDIIDEAIWRSKRNKIKGFVDILFSKRYDHEDMIILKERDFV